MSPHARLPLWADQTSDERIETLRIMVDDLYRYTLGPALGAIDAMLAAHHPEDDKESADIALIRRLIGEHPNLMSENCEVAHLVGSALVIDAHTRRILLHYHKKLDRWLQFGGHAAYEVDYGRVALREATEESGLDDLAFFPDSVRPQLLDVDVHAIPARADRPEHLHLDLRYALVTRHPDRVYARPGESDHFRWLTAEETARESLDPALLRLIRKAARLPL